MNSSYHYVRYIGAILTSDIRYTSEGFFDKLWIEEAICAAVIFGSPIYAISLLNGYSNSETSSMAGNFRETVIPCKVNGF